MLKNMLLVGLGGGIGSVLRWSCSIWLKNQPFPYATLFVNITGSLLIGLLMGLSLHGKMEDNFKLFLVTGICGGFTTFSAFSMENLTMMQQGKASLALLYILISVICGISAAWLGYKFVNA